MRYPIAQTGLNYLSNISFAINLFEKPPVPRQNFKERISFLSTF
jgi:hypothetical protein